MKRYSIQKLRDIAEQDFKALEKIAYDGNKKAEELCVKILWESKRHLRCFYRTLLEYGDYNYKNARQYALQYYVDIHEDISVRDLKYILHLASADWYAARQFLDLPYEALKKFISKDIYTIEDMKDFQTS